MKDNNISCFPKNEEFWINHQGRFIYFNIMLYEMRKEHIWELLKESKTLHDYVRFKEKNDYGAILRNSYQSKFLTKLVNPKNS